MDNELFMRRCFQLAKAGSGRVAPNPMVGSVIVNDGQIIGEGYHTAFGRSHGEVEAINAVKDKSLLKRSVLFVNLEPCSHYGKTPPCADRIIQEGIPEVVIAGKDPNPLVAGNGIRKLEAAGIKVTSGILEEEALELNRRFYCFHEKKRPYVLLKWAQTSDGIMGHIGKSERLLITNEQSTQLVHLWRSREQAILVGKNTALVDDPKLDVRLVEGRSPRRIVLDPDLALPSHLKLFTDGNETVVLNILKEAEAGPVRYIRLDHFSAASILETLYKLQVSSVMIEGGARTLQLFIDSGLWDEARVITSGQRAEGGLKAPHISGQVIRKFSSSGDEVCILKNLPGASYV